MTEQTPMTDADLTAFITRELTSLPSEMASSEREMSNIALDLRVARADLDDEILTVQVNTNADGKNAETRKLQLEKAAFDSTPVQDARSKVVGLESMHLGAEARFNELLRRYKAAIVLGEMQTAKINYRTQFQPKAK